MRHSIAQPRRSIWSWRIASGSPAATRINLLHQIQPRDALRHRVLDLQPGIHLQEVELLVLAHHEFDRAGALIAHGLRERHGLLAHRAACDVVQEGAGRLLDDLLVAPLDRAFALPQVHAVTVCVAQDLDLDVAWLLDELLDEHAVVAEAVGAASLRHDV